MASKKISARTSRTGRALMINQGKHLGFSGRVGERPFVHIPAVTTTPITVTLQPRTMAEPTAFWETHVRSGSALGGPDETRKEITVLGQLEGVPNERARAMMDLLDFGDVHPCGDVQLFIADTSPAGAGADRLRDVVLAFNELGGMWALEGTAIELMSSGRQYARHGHRELGHVDRTHLRFTTLPATPMADAPVRDCDRGLHLTVPLAQEEPIRAEHSPKLHTFPAPHFTQAWETRMEDGLAPLGRAFTALHEGPSKASNFRAAGIMQELGFDDVPVLGEVVIFPSSEYRAYEHLAQMRDALLSTHEQGGIWALAKKDYRVAINLPSQWLPVDF